MSGPAVVEVVKDTFNAILKEAPKKLKDLRDECAAELERGTCSEASICKALRLGCGAAGNPKVVALSLEALHRLFKCGGLLGKGPDPFTDTGNVPARCLIDAVIDSIAGCADQADELVQLRQVEALQAALTTPSCEVHGNSCVLAISTCVKVYKDSKSQTNQRQANQALTQMLSSITQRMELTPGLKIDAGSEAAYRELKALPRAAVRQDFIKSYTDQMIDKVVMQNGAAEEAPGKFGWCVVCRSPAMHYCVDTKDPVCGRTCKQRNLARLKLVNTSSQMTEDFTTDGVSSEATTAAATTIAEAMATTSSQALTVALGEQVQPESLMELEAVTNPYHRDTLLVFHYLCKMSMKDLPPATNGQVASNPVRVKKLSLELVSSILQNSGPVIRSSEHFIMMVKKLTCIALIKNSVSSVPKIFSLSLQIFMTLITNFREHLRMEIGVFIEQIFLRILESGNSSFQHKNRVLHTFYKLCTDASTALELFLNFDCDVDEKNIFERMVDCLSKIAQGKYTSLEHSNLIQPHQEQELKGLALQALVTLMESIVDWAKRVTEEQQALLTSTLIASKKKEETYDATGDSDGDDDIKSNSTAAKEAATAAVTVGSTPNAASSIVSQKQRKLELQIGVNKFNMKPKRGIEYLKQMGFISDNPQDMAELFLKGELGLDKTAIGDYLGEDKPFNKAILYSLVESRDFRQQELDISLRNFLSIFRLPGEAQKIDRMMEKFAEKYCQDNPDVFANADCAFVLSFSLIMLQTDLHNPGVVRKMTKDEFVRNNRGINNGQDLPREYLEGLYDSIVANPIALKEDEELKNRLDSQAAQSWQKQDLFQRETESMITKTQEMMREKSRVGKSSAYVVAQSVEHIRPLFEVACWPYLATLAVLLEMSDDNANTVALCIEGFKHCIRIAARFEMETERDAFVSSLAKFTYLTTIKEMKQKNIECIKALLMIGLSEGDNLGPSWQYVLFCISQLQRMELLGTHRKQDFLFFGGEDEVAASPTGQHQATRSNSISTKGGEVVKRRAHGLGVSALVNLGQDDRQVELVNSESVVSQIDSAQIELLFNKTTSLSPQAIVHFVTQLARVSKEELALADQPRIFSLQKLVEVADYNMRRSRLEWQKMWRAMSKHFIEAASHPNIKVCLYTIDCVRQLAWKFLDKEELSMFQFQADFLQPFEVLMVSTPNVAREVKDHIVSIIAWMVEKKASGIKSGWKIVFHIFRAAAQDSYEEITQTAFASMEYIIREKHDVLIDNFTDGIGALLAFGQCQCKGDVSKKSIEHLMEAADNLAEKAAASMGSDKVSGADPSAVRHPAEHWLHILRGLSSLGSDNRREVRSAALDGLFDCLQKHGSSSFDEDTWRLVFNTVIKPLFDDIHHQMQPRDQQKQPSDRGTQGSQSFADAPSTCLQALTALVRLVDEHLALLSFLMDDVLKLIRNCITHDTESLARIGVEGFKQLLLLAGRKMDQTSWAKVTVCIKELFANSMPKQLMCVEVTASGEGELPFRKDDVVIQCVVQLLLIDMLQETFRDHYPVMPAESVMTLLDALKNSYEFAQEFNQQIELRQTLKRLGFIREMRQLPGLLKQEREALSCSLTVLFQVQADPKFQETEYAEKAIERLMQMCSMVLKNYINKERMIQEQHAQAEQQQQADSTNQEREAVQVEMEREVLGLVPIISYVVMTGLKDLQSELFSRHVQILFPLLCELTAVSSWEVREKVRSVLLKQVGPILGVSYTEEEAPKNPEDDGGSV